MYNFNIQFFEKLIPDCNNYYAHIPKSEQKCKKPELLAEHSAKVVSYAQEIVKAHHLSNIIENLIKETIPENLENKQLLAKTINKLFWQAIAFHDFGKLNHKFQINRMKNETDVLKVKHSFQNQHSVISVYLYLALFFADFLKLELSDEEQIFICNVALYLSYTIYKHHSKTIEQAQNEENWDNKNLFSLSPYLSLFSSPLDEKQIKLFHSSFLENANFNFFFDFFNENVFKTKNAFPLYTLVRLNYSLLTASDYLATAHYMNNWKNMLTDFGILNENLKKKIIINAQNLKPYNKEVYNSIANGEKINPDNYKEQSNKNLNILRQSIAIEVISNVKTNADKNLFYIEAPTGGGKTNVSILALAELLKTDNSLKKAFYVFPFTTLITQTYQSLKETLGLKEGELAEISSKAALQKRTPDSEKEEDSDYKNYIDDLFLNYPITLLSHVRFFDVLKTNKKSTNYLLHRLANSVVIIDEIQSYSPKIWDKIIYFIVNYAKYLHMKFIIMSATLPKIGDIIDRKELVNDFVYLIKDKKKYFQNPNFCNRVKFDYSLLEWKKPDKNEISDYLEKLCDTVFEKSNIYAQSSKKYPNSVFTIIEFIFKKSAGEFYSIAKNRNNEFFDEILLLSGTILEPRKKQVINELKSQTARKKKILLITTQVVEAGVDIDMDIGFKDKSIIDSEEQLAGRINRNVNKPSCKLFLFDCNEEKILYGRDDRYSIMSELGDTYSEILEHKDFDKLYKLIIQKIKRKNKSKYIENINDLIEQIATLNFRNVNESFKIIDHDNVSIFVPLNISVNFIGKTIDTIKELKIPYSTDISGIDVWNKYSEIITSEDEDFITNKIRMRELQSIMSLFTFSVFPNGKDYESLKTYGIEEYGFLYLENYDEIFSFEDGLLVESFSNSNFL